MQPERPSLAQVQRALAARLTGRSSGQPALDIEASIAGDARASAGDRLAVYAHMVAARLIEALASQYPRLARHLGPDDFGVLAAAYLDDHPSRHWSLRFVGERFPGWLAARRPSLLGLATLEWARADVFDLADDSPLALEDIRRWPPERFGEIPLRLVTAHRRVTVAAGTAALWDSPGGDAPASGDVESLVVWREGTAVYHRVLGATERAALDLAAQGTEFGALCTALLADDPEEAALQRAHAWLSTWLRDGLLAAQGRP